MSSFLISGKCAEAKVFADSLEASTTAQLVSLCDQEFARDSHIRIMPDAHAGAGCVIGTTMNVANEMIVPNLVGVDIGCGMEVTRLQNFTPDFAKLDKVIRETVPSGFASRESVHPYMEEVHLDELRCHALQKEKAKKSLGSLGGGNHFIEVARGSDDAYYLIVHSGSRNPGLLVAQHYQEIADKYRGDTPKGLAPLVLDDFDDYVHDMRIMQDFAFWNRKAITKSILDGMKWKAEGELTTIHNYLDTEWMILRKGAVSAKKGETLLIPMNMRDGSLLCEGLGNEDWNYSAPHGAGRLMSRAAARESFTLTQFKDDMEGIWTSCVCRDTIDENPRAYKPMEDILRHIGETVRVIDTLKPVYNFKAAESDRKKNWKKKRASRERSERSERDDAV